MFSPATLQAMSDEAAEDARVAGLLPYVPFSTAEVDAWSRFPFPDLGSYTPEGWDLKEEVMADSSGMGSTSEPALTMGQLKAWCKDQMNLNADTGFAITTVGQFQVIIGAFVEVW